MPADQLAELIEVKAEVARRIAATYGYISFYEHGRAGHCSANAECNHFHLHALPVTCSIVEPLAVRYRRMPLTNYGAITDTFERFGDYLYFEDTRGAMSFFPATSTVESHLLRTLIASAIGAPDRANWEEMRDPAMVDTARTRLEPTDEHRARQLSR